MHEIYLILLKNHFFVFYAKIIYRPNLIYELVDEEKCLERCVKVGRNIAQRPIYFKLEVLNKPENLTWDTKLKIPPGGCVLRTFTS